MRAPQELVTEGKLDKAEWPTVYQKKYPKSWWYHLKLCFNKKQMLLLRDKAYLKSQVIGAIVMGERTGIKLEHGPPFKYSGDKRTAFFLTGTKMTTAYDALCFLFGCQRS